MLRRASQRTTVLGRTINRFSWWAGLDKDLDGPFAGPPLRAHERAVARRWAAAQRDWNLHVEVLADRDGRPRVLAIAGAEDSNPEWLIYPCNSGYQTDDFAEAVCSPTLEDALCAIGAMPRGTSLDLPAPVPADAETITPSATKTAVHSLVAQAPCSAGSDRTIQVPWEAGQRR
jgi:hypothetical protein